MGVKNDAFDYKQQLGDIDRKANQQVKQSDLDQYGISLRDVGQQIEDQAHLISQREALLREQGFEIDSPQYQNDSILQGLKSNLDQLNQQQTTLAGQQPDITNPEYLTGRGLETATQLLPTPAARAAGDIPQPDNNYLPRPGTTRSRPNYLLDN